MLTGLAVATLPVDEIKAAHENLLSQKDIQFSFEVPDTPERLDLNLPDWLASVLRVIGVILSYLFWLGLALLLGLIAYLIFQSVRPPGKRPDLSEPEEPEVYTPTKARAQALLSEADELAAEGRYAEAIHLLLFRSIDDIEKARPGSVNDAMTSREIQGLEVLSALARTAFTRIASVVEDCQFAGKSADNGHWQDCRDAYAALTGEGQPA